MGRPNTTSGLGRSVYRTDRGDRSYRGDAADRGETRVPGAAHNRTGMGYNPTGVGRGPGRSDHDDRGSGFGFRHDGRDGRSGHYYDGRSSSRFAVHTYIRPHYAGLRIGVRRPVYYRGTRVVACVPSYGFGFFTPLVAPYPVYPAPIYEPPLVADPGYYYDPGYYAPEGYAMPGPEYYGGDYGYAPPPEGVAGPPMPMAPPTEPAPEDPGMPAEPLPEDNAPPPPAGELIPPAGNPADSQPGQATQRASGQQPADQEAVQRQMADGMAMFAAGEYEKAGRQFLRLALADQSNIDAWLGYAVARFATRNYEPAAMAVRRAIRAFPDAVNSPVDIRQPYGQSGDFDRQAAALEDYLRTNADSADAWLVLGFIRHFSGQRELATKTFEVIQRRFERDRDLADLFLKAKSQAEIEREAVPPTEPGTGSITSDPLPPDDSGAAPLTSEPRIAPPAPAPQPDPSAPPPPIEELLDDDAAT